MFSTSHIAAVLVILGVCILMYVLKSEIRGKGTKKFRLSLAAILIFQEVSFQIWSITTGLWSVKYTLPLQLCSITTILTAVLLVTKSKKLYEVIYFWGIGGAIQALLTPEIGIYTYPHFRYFEFFIAHGTIIAGCLFMTFVEGYRPKLKSVWKSMIVLNIYALFVGIFNKIVGANYMFLCAKPEVSSIMDILGPWPFYIATLEIVAVVFFLILYLPFTFSP